MSENGLHKIPVMREALEAIRELHKPFPLVIAFDDKGEKVTDLACSHCTAISEEGVYWPHPCSTRRLADRALEAGNE